MTQRRGLLEYSMGCWELNLNLSLLRNFSSIQLLNYEDPHDEN